MTCLSSKTSPRQQRPNRQACQCGHAYHIHAPAFACKARLPPLPPPHTAPTPPDWQSQPCAPRPCTFRHA
eukprot:213522-Chlamydomonas_euryale.AAC.1